VSNPRKGYGPSSRWGKLDWAIEVEDLLDGRLPWPWDQHGAWLTQEKVMGLDLCDDKWVDVGIYMMGD